MTLRRLPGRQPERAAPEPRPRRGKASNDFGAVADDDPVALDAHHCLPGDGVGRLPLRRADPEVLKASAAADDERVDLRPTRTEVGAHVAAAAEAPPRFRLDQAA